MHPPAQPQAPELPLTDEFFNERAHFLRAIYRAVAVTARGLSPRSGQPYDLSTDDYKRHNQLMAMHPAFARHELKAIGRLGQWNRKYPNMSGLTFIETVGYTSYWRLRNPLPSGRPTPNHARTDQQHGIRVPGPQG